MDRLTKRDNRTKSGCKLPTYATKNEENVFIKLFQLENLEEELGIDLITLFKALKDGIYVELRDFIKHVSIKDLSLKFFGERWCLGFYHSLNGGTFYVNLKDYGKTWALSRNDLEKKDDE